MLATAAGQGPLGSDCFHCGLPVPAGSACFAEVDNQPRAMCCQGCAAVSRAIVAAGLDSYYRYRTDKPGRAGDVVPESLRHLEIYDNPEVQRSFVRSSGAVAREASLMLEGITCPACLWLNEQHIGHLPGVEEARINYSTHRAEVRWDSSRIKLSDILEEIRSIGYEALPYDSHRQRQVFEEQRNQLLRRLGVGCVFGMQVMILAVALYAGAWSGIEAQFSELFRRISLLLTLPIVMYAAEPFFAAAWSDLSRGQAGMDVPVSLAIALAFIASVWATLSGQGHVYYESIAMFVVLLLGARYLELSARDRTCAAIERLGTSTLQTATRIDTIEGKETSTTVSALELRAGDRVLILPGENVPADGRIVDGQSTVNESILTGESLPERRAIGDRIIGGSLNIESPLTMEVTEAGPDSVLSAIQRLLERAQTDKPSVAQTADRLATWFVTGVLILATGTAVGWWFHDPARWLPITVAVLAVSCPCALSLATPTAITATVNNLMSKGILLTRGNSLEVFARATHFVFDKTGTLTAGEPQLISSQPLGDNSTKDCIAIAAALEKYSEHPLAQAIVTAADKSDVPVATGVRNCPGAGLHGFVNGERYVVGTLAYVCAQTGLGLSRFGDIKQDATTIVVLASNKEALCIFRFRDSLRPDARQLIDDLKRAGKKIILLTGDHRAAALPVANELGITNVQAGLNPEGKLKEIEALQARGATVVMIGDGVNDAPVLAKAHASIAVAGATPLAAMSADCLLLGKSIAAISETISTARRTLAIVRQNLAWALAYNLLALPAAALGFVPPWIAAAGMSASSLLVVLNALRLNRSLN